VIVTSNLPFSEWTTMFPNARLCKAMLDRLTDQAHIIETGSDSYRFRRTLERKRKIGQDEQEAPKEGRTGGATGRPDRQTSSGGTSWRKLFHENRAPAARTAKKEKHEESGVTQS